jgi:hypothetical protein
MLDRTVTHKRPDYSARDSSGAPTPSYNTLNADVPACIAPMAADPVSAAAFDRKDIVTDFAIYTDSNLGVKAKDEIVDGTDVYQVEGAMEFRNTMVANVTVYVIAANLRKV